MSAQMKASVLLTLKEDITTKGKAAVNAIKELGGAAARVKGTNALGKMAGDAVALGSAADKAAASLSRVGATKVSGSGLAAAAKDADALAAAANRAAAATQKAGNAAAFTGASRPHRSWTGVTPWESKQADRYAQIEADARARKEIRDRMKAEEKPAGGAFFGVGGKIVNTFFGLQLAGMAAHAADGVATRVGDVDAMRTKLRWAMGGDQGAADAAYDKAVALSGKYKNTTVLENLHIIDDLRANLPETMDHILKDAADPFVRMHGFFKAWEGGKHKGKAEHALKDIGDAIRAGELTGISSADDLVKHTQALATAKILFGEKFKVREYFQATQKAATALSAADDTFKYVDFPILIQRLSQGAGVALRTGFTKFVAGGTVSQQTAENWRGLGLVDESKVQFDKGGKIKASSLLGTSWLKDGDALAKNFSDGIMEKVLPAMVAKGGLAGLKGLPEAWKAGDVEKATHILTEFRKDKAAMAKLAQISIALAKDPSAAKLVEETITGAASDLRDRERGKAIQKNVEDYESYDKAKQALGAQADRLLQIATGDGIMGNINKAIDAVTGLLGRIGDKMSEAKKHPNTFGLDGNDKDWWRALPTWMGGDGIDYDWDGTTRDWLGRAKASIFAPGFSKEVWDWGKLPEAGAMGAAAKAGAVGFEGGEEAGRARAAAAGGRYQLAGSEAREAEAQGIASGDGPATAAAGAEPVVGGAATAPITIQAVGPQVTFNQAPPNISINVTVNATTNASAGEIGAAAAGQVRSALGGALHDGGQ